MTNELDIDLYVNAAIGRKAVDLVVLDVHELTSVADFFIICSGTSNRQVSAIAEHIQTDLKKMKKYPLSVEGAREGLWGIDALPNILDRLAHGCQNAGCSTGYRPRGGGYFAHDRRLLPGDRRLPEATRGQQDGSRADVRIV